MHIAFWSPAWPLAKYHNGIVTYVHWMKRELENQGHRVSVFTTSVDPSDEEPGIYRVQQTRGSLSNRALRRLTRRGRTPDSEVFDFSGQITAAIARVHQQDPIDVIEMEESFGWFGDVAARTGIPLLVKLHGPAFLSLVEEELDTPFGREKIEREGRALKGATAIVSPCRSTLHQTISRYGLTPRHSGHVVNPVAEDANLPLWSPDHCDRNAILFVGRFDLRKGGDIILQAFRQMLQSRPALRLIFVGPDRGITTEGGQHTHFEQYCEQLFDARTRQRVEFRGPLPNSEISQLRTQAMVTTVASRWENLGYTVLEAMLQGCPLVSSDAGGSPEIVTSGATGRLARSADPSDFAAQLTAMLEDPVSAATMGQAARRHVVEHYAASRVAAESLQMYDELLASH